VEHPNVATATDFGQTDDGAFFLVLEYVEGTSLRVALGKGAMAPARALHIARQIAFALERAHAAGIVHRDLKPENVMLVSKGDDPDFVKVLDFGIAKVEPHPTRDATQPLTRLGTILGTPEYMAPEQALGEIVGPGADLYAVGVMLYEMLTGRHPFDADDRMAILSMHIVAPVPKMLDRNPAVDVSAPVEELVRRLLEKDAKLRPAGARALIESIETAAGQSGIELPHGGSTRSFGRESNPDVMRVTPAAPMLPTELPAQAAPTSESSWTANDALAKTDYGLPAAALTPAAMPKAAAKDPVQRVIDQATALLDRAGPRLKQLPRGALIGVAAIVPVFVLILVVTLIVARRSSGDEDGVADAAPTTSGARAVARATRAGPERLAAAAAQGIPALEALSTEFPEDSAIQRQIVLSLAESGRNAEALRAVRVLAKRDKDAIDERVLRIVVAAAQRGETLDEAFSLLEGPLGTRGVDGLIELSTSKAARAVRLRADRSLARAEIRANASAAASVLIDLKAAKDCQAKHDVVERAKDSGDERALPTLKALKNPRGCGFVGMRDCYPCLRRDDALDDAIRGIEARSSR
jgi:serine/threonine-protein kinase